ncbi:MAG: methyltransferase [Betaproteobacteria bacterium]
MTWLERWLAQRDRLLANPRFRRWAAAFPFTRPIARRRARELFDLCAGFVYTQVLLTCVRLDLFEKLAAGPHSAAALATKLGLSADATSRLMEAAISLRLVERRGDRFALGPLGAPMVGNAAIVAMVEHHALLYADLHDPVALLRGAGPRTGLAQYWSYANAERPDELEAERVSAYTRLMSASQSLVADEILDAYPMRRHRCLLDVGGGDGTFLLAAAARSSTLRVTLFDLPAVAERARARFAAAGIADRARAVGGNFHAEPLPSGADIVALVRVIHDHNDTEALALLRAARRALPPGGTLLLAEPMADTPGAEAMGGAYFGFYLLAMGQGRPRTPSELGGMLHAAGFGRVRPVATHLPLQTRLLVAQAMTDRHTVKKY